MIKSVIEQNLKNAFSGESQAHMRYGIFSDISRYQAYKNVARLFKAIEFAERIHATNHYNRLECLYEGSYTIGNAGFGPGSISKNLNIAMEGEIFEINEMHPVSLEIANFQNEFGAVKSFEWALEAEKTHAEFFKKAKDCVDIEVDIEINKIQVCRICGHTLERESPDKCPICKAKKNRFKSF